MESKIKAIRPVDQREVEESYIKLFNAALPSREKFLCSRLLYDKLQEIS